MCDCSPTTRVLRGSISTFGGWHPFSAALLEAVTVAVHLEDMDMVGKAVEQRAGESF